MNYCYELIHNHYRTVREGCLCNITELESEIILLAENGLSYPLVYMDDLSSGENILIKHYTNKYREKQLYDFMTVEDVLKICDKGEFYQSEYNLDQNLQCG